ncbi:conserved hypothetical protein [Beggiatoa sp. PS]|nr:conserved hypothetical protein [Beggiatoa sp. PS]
MFRLLNLLIALLFASSVWAQDDSCNSSGCRYAITLERAGAYVAVVRLPSGQPEGLWGLVINPSLSAPPYQYGFWAGSILKEQAEMPSWVGFSLYERESINVIPYDWTGNGLPITVKIDRDIGDGSRALAYGPKLMAPGQMYIIPSLEPGFYITELFTQPDAPRTYFGLAIEGDSLYGGVSGGWLDSYGEGYAAFIIKSPTTMDFLLLFGDTLPGLGAGQPHLEVYYQHEEGASRELVWVAELPKLQPSELPPDYADTVETIPISPLIANSSVENLTQSLYNSDDPNATQTGVTRGAVCPSQAAILRGKVADQTGQPLAGVIVSVQRYSEFGETLSDVNGQFALAVDSSQFEAENLPTINYDKEGYLPLDRQVTNIRAGYVNASEVAMVPRGASQQPLGQGNRAVDLGRGKLLFPQDTAATMTLPDCSVVPLDESFTVQAGEYTVDTANLGTYSMDDPARQVAANMPFPLPPATGYTYAIELNASPALNTRGRPIARGVNFVRSSSPDESAELPMYVDNFLNFEVGDDVPVGWYDRQQSAWIPSTNGRIVKLLGIENGLAVLDIDGSGQAATPQALLELGVSNEERQQLASQYPNHAGTTLWRVPISHFSPWDCNWPFGPPENSGGPTNEDDAKSGPEVEDDEDKCNQDGCIIDAQSQVLGETLPIAGTPFSLNYRSSQVPGRKAAYILDIPLRGDTMPEALPERVEMEVTIAGQAFLKTCPLQEGQIVCQKSSDTDPISQSDDKRNAIFTWDGKDAFGRNLLGRHLAKARVSYVYKGDYQKPAVNTSSSFGLGGGSISGDRARQEISFDRTYQKELGGWDAKLAVGFGGWTLDIQHVYDKESQTLYAGDGSQRSVQLTPTPPKPPEPEKKPAEEEEEPLTSPFEPPKPTVVNLSDSIRVSHCTPQCVTTGEATMSCTADCGQMLVGAAHLETDALQWIGTESVDKFRIEGQQKTLVSLAQSMNRLNLSSTINGRYKKKGLYYCKIHRR